MGAIFATVDKNIISTEQSEFVTDCDIEWDNIQQVQQQYLDRIIHVSPQTMKAVQKLEKNLLTNSTLISCIQIYREIHQAIIDLTTINLPNTNQPTRQNNMLYLVLTTHPNLMKAPHKMIVTAAQLPSHRHLRQSYQSAKSAKKNIKEEIKITSNNVSISKVLVQLTKCIDKNIPSRQIKTINQSINRLE